MQRIVIYDPPNLDAVRANGSDVFVGPPCIVSFVVLYSVVDRRQLLMHIFMSSIREVDLRSVKRPPQPHIVSIS